MKKIQIIILSLAMFAGLWGPPLASKAAAGDWEQKGASIYPNWQGDFGSDDFKKSIDALAAAKANYAALIIPFYQTNLYSTDVQKGGNTPTDESLISAIGYIHSKGLKVMLKPHLESYTYEWRANINPSNRQEWFNNYGQLLLHYAGLAKDYGAEDICVGTELINMAAADQNSTNTQNWKNLIAKIRAAYPGKLTYSANWGPAGFTDEKNHIQFWDSLDYVGISAYFNLYGDNSVQNLKNQWNNYLGDVQNLSRQWNKPVVFTEVGYKSVSGAHTQPWDYNFGGSYDATGQANAYQALFEFWGGQSFMRGVELWDWKSNAGAGGNGNTDYTPQNKTAQNIMVQYFGSAPTPPPANPNFSPRVVSAPPTSPAGQVVNINFAVSNKGEPVADIIVDAEIYDASGQKVFQQYFSGQDFITGQERSYQINWTMGSSSKYKFKIGVFNYNWQKNYLWQDSAAELVLASPASAQIDIWWPTNGVTLAGQQPLKALLKDVGDINSYEIYWQLEGGQWQKMPTNLTDYPHKETVVDVSGWNFKGNGPYAINFAARSLSGQVLAQRTVQVNVWH